MEYFRVPCWAGLRHEILRRFDAERTQYKYRPADMVNFAKETSKKPITSMTQWRKYSVKYNVVAGGLYTQGRLSEEHYLCYFWCGIAKDLRTSLEARILQGRSLQDMLQYSLHEINVAAEWHFRRIYDPNEDSNSDIEESESESEDEQYRNKRRREQSSSHHRKIQEQVRAPAASKSSRNVNHVAAMIRQLNAMSVDDPEYASTYYTMLSLDETGIAGKCVKSPGKSQPVPVDAQRSRRTSDPISSPLVPQAIEDAVNGQVSSNVMLAYVDPFSRARRVADHTSEESDWDTEEEAQSESEDSESGFDTEDDESEDDHGDQLIYWKVPKTEPLFHKADVFERVYPTRHSSTHPPPQTALSSQSLHPSAPPTPFPSKKILLEPPALPKEVPIVANVTPINFYNSTTRRHENDAKAEPVAPIDDPLSDFCMTRMPAITIDEPSSARSHLPLDLSLTTRSSQQTPLMKPSEPASNEPILQNEPPREEVQDAQPRNSVSFDLNRLAEVSPSKTNTRARHTVVIPIIEFVYAFLAFLYRVNLTKTSADIPIYNTSKNTYEKPSPVVELKFHADCAADNPQALAEPEYSEEFRGTCSVMNNTRDDDENTHRHNVDMPRSWLEAMNEQAMALQNQRLCYEDLSPVTTAAPYEDLSPFSFLWSTRLVPALVPVVETSVGLGAFLKISSEYDLGKTESVDTVHECKLAADQERQVVLVRSTAASHCALSPLPLFSSQTSAVIDDEDKSGMEEANVFVEAQKVVIARTELRPAPKEYEQEEVTAGPRFGLEDNGDPLWSLLPCTVLPSPTSFALDRLCSVLTRVLHLPDNDGAYDVYRNDPRGYRRVSTNDYEGQRSTYLPSQVFAENFVTNDSRDLSFDPVATQASELSARGLASAPSVRLGAEFHTTRTWNARESSALVRRASQWRTMEYSYGEIQVSNELYERKAHTHLAVRFFVDIFTANECRHGQFPRLREAFD
ncbi:hypothetical protein C8F01DRAFT_1266996 [Mycena amicta]|nr:hypothetical protein C8F01DRAFT_1266996 [Mycena amicta]